MTRRLLLALAALGVALSLGVLAAWPIYRTPWLWLVAAVSLVGGMGLALARERWKWNFPITVLAVLGFFLITVVPVAVPSAFDRVPEGLASGFVDGLAAIAVGWKQLLTLSLPVGTYRTVLVPAYVVFLLTSFIATFFALRRSTRSALAAVPMLAPVAFGTIFGASAVSDPWRFGFIVVHAPRELGLWLAIAVICAVWIGWTAGAERRAALRRGGATSSRGRLVRLASAAGIIVIALIAGLTVAPVLTANAREVPRDRIDPEIVVRDQPSPLAGYRASKRDAAFETPILTVSGEGALPPTLRFSVLDEYDGTDFRVSEDAAGRFTRFPSGETLAQPGSVTIDIAEGYSEIWAPTAPLGEPPRFRGPRAAELDDAFYVNRLTDAAIVVPEGDGLEPGDGYSAEMETVDPPAVAERPAQTAPFFDVETTPELATWLEAQDVSATGAGLVDLIDRLRARGYLSHSISDDETAWLRPLEEQFGTRFESSAGGHSLVRIEALFAQLNSQERSAGEDPREADLVAGIGDDEQFATAAALIARALGFESRVVVGVRLGADSGAEGGSAASAGVPGIPACTDVCTGQHLSAWIEVRGERGPWAPIDVTPQAEIRPHSLEEGEQLPEFPTVPEEHDAQQVDPPLGLGDQNDPAENTPEDEAAGWWWPILRVIGLSLAALALLALPFLFLPLAKRRRAAGRRQEPLPELRAVGAWDEMVDRARDAGLRVRSGASRREVGDALGTAPARWAAGEVDRAVFSPSGVTDVDADILWEAADADRAEREQGLTWWQRLAAAYSVRSYGISFRAAARGGEGAGTRREVTTGTVGPRRG